MSSGSAFTLGLVVGIVVTMVTFLLVRSSARRAPVPPAGELVEQVSEVALAQARELVARGRIVHAVKVVREATGFDLVRAKAVVDTLPRDKKDDDHVGGMS